VTEAIRQGDIPGVQLRCRAHLAVPPEEAWRRLTEPRGLETWLCDEAEMPAAGAGGFRWVGCSGLEVGTVEEGTVVAIEPFRRWMASVRQPGWSAATRLQIDLEPMEGGCEVSVLQNGFEHLPLSISLTVWELYRRRWRAVLERLAESLRSEL
jgi:uncharacterized protein YndB with AHSA1/START domain